LAAWHLTLVEAALAEAETERRAGLSGAVVAFTDQGTKVEVELAKVSTRYDT
jgi:hypothetical protein